MLLRLACYLGWHHTHGLGKKDVLEPGWCAVRHREYEQVECCRCRAKWWRRYHFNP